jgi:hypothetical protein
MMHASPRGEDVTLFEGAITMNPNDARMLAASLYQAAAEAIQYGQECNKATDGGMGVETPARPRHSVAVLLAGGVLVDVQIVEGAPPRIRQGGGYHQAGEFIYELSTESPQYLSSRGVTFILLTYELKARA